MPLSTLVSYIRYIQILITHMHLQMEHTTKWYKESNVLISAIICFRTPRTIPVSAKIFHLS